MIKVLVIGGTGTMGAPLVDRLVSAGNQVDVLVRHYHTDKENVHYIAGDGYDDAFMRSSVLTNHYDAIVDFLWYNEDSLRARVKDLLDATNHYICLSSAAVYADSNDLQTEEYPRFIDILPRNEVIGNHQYHLEKARVEDVLKEQAQSNWTIIRPHVTFNDGHLPLSIWGDRTWLFRTLNGHAFTLPKNLMHKRTNFTYGGDVAKMIVMLLEGSEKAFGETFNVVSDRIIDSAELLSIYSSILAKLGYPVKVVYEPDMRRWCANFPESTDRIEYDRALNRTFSNAKFKRVIGDVTYELLEDSLETCLLGYIENWKKGKIPNLLVDRLLYEDKMTHESTKISEFITAKDRKNFLCEKYGIVNLIYHTLYPLYAKVIKRR